MRMMVKAVFDNQVTTEAISKGTMQKDLEEMLGRLKPEAVYFVGEDGQRAMLTVLDMTDSSQMPAIAEPMFRAGARVTFLPCMSLEDAQRGLGALTS